MFTILFGLSSTLAAVVIVGSLQVNEDNEINIALFEGLCKIVIWRQCCVF